jgi:hypothetical protein
MGMLDMFRHQPGLDGDEWTPPTFGACECEGHIEDVLKLRIPLAGAGGEGGDGEPQDMAVWALLTSGGLATVPLDEERRHLTDGVSLEQRGPFHWEVTAGERLRPFVAAGDLRLVEEALDGRAGVAHAMWIEREGALVVSAPTLCANGVQCAVVLALRSPQVRAADAPPASSGGPGRP